MTDIIEKLKLLDKGYVEIVIHEHWDKSQGWLFDETIDTWIYGGAVGMFSHADGVEPADRVREEQEEFTKRMEQLGLVGNGIAVLRVPVAHDEHGPWLDVANAVVVEVSEERDKGQSEAALAVAEIERLRAEIARLRKIEAALAVDGAR